MLWDVGHQSYPHKILTGRRDQLPTIRQYEGLAPFCSIAESEHDIMGAGHASTSIGYAVGLKEAMRKGLGEDGRVAAVIGDGALTGGVAYEALHAAGGLQTPLVILYSGVPMLLFGRKVADLAPMAGFIFVPLLLTASYITWRAFELPAKNWIRRAARPAVVASRTQVLSV